MKKYSSILLFLVVVVVFIIQIFHINNLTPPVVKKPPTRDTSSPLATTVTIAANNYFPNVTCCNTCPTPKITIIPVYKVKVFPLRIPYPVFKPFPFIIKQECRKGFTRVGHNKCIRTIEVKIGVKCPPGYFRVSDTKCIRIEIIFQKIPKFNVVCPPGYKPKGIACVKGQYKIPGYKLPPRQRGKIKKVT